MLPAAATLLREIADYVRLVVAGPRHTEAEVTYVDWPATLWGTEQRSQLSVQWAAVHVDDGAARHADVQAYWLDSVQDRRI